MKPHTCSEAHFSSYSSCCQAQQEKQEMLSNEGKETSTWHLITIKYLLECLQCPGEENVPCRVSIGYQSVKRRLLVCTLHNCWHFQITLQVNSLVLLALCKISTYSFHSKIKCLSFQEFYSLSIKLPISKKAMQLKIHLLLLLRLPLPTIQ